MKTESAGKISRGNAMGAVWFLVHFLVETVCFALIGRKIGFGWTVLLSLLYDFFAFVPQGLIGMLNAVSKKTDLGSIGCGLMAAGILFYAMGASWSVFLGIVLLAVGNAFLHECGAIAAVVCGEGKLLPGALFVSGGSLGVALGKYLAAGGGGIWFCLLLTAVIEILVLLTNRFWLGEDAVYPEYDLTERKFSGKTVLLWVVAITAVRSYIAYAIPISWNKQWWQTFLLFAMMGVGKGIGGWCADRFGARRTGILTSLAAIPFLLCGERQMVISVFGVLLFSMTMSVTFGMALSVLKDLPGAAFGVTTVGLFLGILPALIFGKPPLWLGSVLVAGLSVLAAAGFGKICKHENKIQKSRQEGKE